MRPDEPERRQTIMQLTEVLRGMEALLYMERYVDEGTKTYSPFAGRSEVAPEYRPQSARPSFSLISVRVPRDRMSVYMGDADKRLVEHYIRRDDVEFLIHPETWADPNVEHMLELRALERG